MRFIQINPTLWIKVLHIGSFSIQDGYDNGDVRVFSIWFWSKDGHCLGRSIPFSSLDDAKIWAKSFEEELNA